MTRNEGITNQGQPPFAMVPHYITEDIRIGGNAFRIIAYLIGKPEGWVVRNEDIQKRLNLKRGKFETARKELIDAGYINKHTIRSGKSGNPLNVYDFYYDPANNPEYDGELPKYDVFNKKGSPEGTGKPNTRDDVDKGTTGKSINRKNVNATKKPKNFTDNASDFNPRNDLFFEE